MIKKLTTLTLLALCGCAPTPDMTTGNLGGGDGISVTRVGVFADSLAYDNRRGVYRIVDTKTGREFIGISGIGITETGSHLVGKVYHQDER